MVITKTPFRMSFFGGGTDVEQYFRDGHGAVLSSTFDKYCYVTVRHLPRFFEYKSHLTYSRMEYVNTYDEIQHPAIRNAMKMLDMHEIRLTYESDLPAKSGLGTSSSFAVGMLSAFHALKGQYVDKAKLADEAIYLERIMCSEMGGWQDQIAASFGGFNRINFSAEGYEVLPVIISAKRKEELNSNLMLFFTGFTRFSAAIQADNNIIKKQNKELLNETYLLVDEAQRIMTDKNTDLDEFGRLLDYAWKIKKDMGTNISTDAIDSFYKRAMKAGALGGKILGAGGGGFLLLYVPIERQQRVREELAELLYVSFMFENSGTKIIHYSPEDFVENK